MPKKHNKYPSIKPASTVHPSLESSTTKRQYGGASRSTADNQSVNDLIQHLRRTQVTSPNDGPSNTSRTVTQRSLHPSLRNILDVPETPPPRPRSNVRPVGGRFFRRTPGPPPPSSWLQTQAPSHESADRNQGVSLGHDLVLYRLERLPGVQFPPKDSLQHAVMKSMAINWAWHLEYDNEFLMEVPSRLKLLILSYIATHASRFDSVSPTHTLDFLFASPEASAAEVGYVTRLDLSGAIGNWISMKALSKQLLLTRKETNDPVTKSETIVPASWDDSEGSIDDDELEAHSLSSPQSPLFKSPTEVLRFPNLRYLSFAHPRRTAVSWGSLLNLLSHMSTLTHLSLAHWPVPTLTPNLINERITHPTMRSVSFAAGGTDTYSADENNWVEAVNILRRLSRATYCLKWLDLEGCGEWFEALSWDGRTLHDDEPFQTLSSAWNGSWRDVEWIGLGPGWIPSQKVDMDDLGPSFIPLAASRHSPASQRQPGQARNPDDDLTSVLTEQDLREAAIAREQQRRVNERKAYEETLRKARRVEKHIHRVRREGGGKWIHFSFGGEGVEEQIVLEKVLAKIDS
ncbi:uncharacterized protein BHQ10_001161 [Talaromyces amestolkiae]|uniref:Uncharacterized protein n=1 Tax=Talaromyces amestolkiae TaxID=1196081 RepID=A0A364KNN9_TALAM|nr:uncharacterized protein BHQ10_001161 [Talaromyces amestolkiae]RAO65149.1 hypothetical protein BHQ10_001161 [Talaromyces amestolkiae]